MVGKHGILNDDVPMKSSIREELWQLRKSDPKRFKQEVTDYFEKRYPEWRVIKSEYPYIYLERIG